MKQEIIDILTFLVNAVGESVVYGEHWSTDYSHKNICKQYNRAIDALKKDIDWDSLTDTECRELRFGVWDKNNPLRLIPIWLYKAIPIGTKLTSINGEEVIFDGNNIDTDIRLGCLAWGIIPKDKQSTNNEE